MIKSRQGFASGAGAGGGLDGFRARIAPALAGAGSVVQRFLLSLEIVTTEDSMVLAPARVRVELERRYLEFKLVFRESPTGTWELLGVGAGETLDSQIKFAPPESESKEPPESPPPAPKPEKPAEKPPPSAAKP